ncbi:unnamed protein product [Moneuplotes crassus]|uniref:Uncharacterized protein n=1 Tax=Euplotes crassus TaxID=5936 RepID=A0AAD1UDG1_EUPCR|nr:unnamed protein product [Moneuplotes crassus]
MSTRQRKTRDREVPDFFGAWSLHKSCERSYSEVTQRARKGNRREHKFQNPKNAYTQALNNLKRRKCRGKKNKLITIAPPNCSRVNYKEKVYKFKRDEVKVPETKDKVMDIFMSITETCPSTNRRNSQTRKCRKVPPKTQYFSKPQDCYSAKRRPKKKKTRSVKKSCSSSMSRQQSMNVNGIASNFDLLSLTTMLKPSKVKVSKMGMISPRYYLNFAVPKKQQPVDNSQKSSIEISLQRSSKPSTEDYSAEVSSQEEDLAKNSCFKHTIDNRCSLESTTIQDQPNKEFECPNRVNRLLVNEFTKRLAQNSKTKSIRSSTKKRISASSNLDYSFIHTSEMPQIFNRSENSQSSLAEKENKPFAPQRRSLLLRGRDSEPAPAVLNVTEPESVLTQANRHIYQGFETDGQISKTSFKLEEDSEDASKCPECKRFFMVDKIEEHIKLCKKAF